MEVTFSILSRSNTSEDDIRQCLSMLSKQVVEAEEAPVIAEEARKSIEFMIDPTQQRSKFCAGRNKEGKIVSLLAV